MRGTPNNVNIQKPLYAFLTSFTALLLLVFPCLCPADAWGLQLAVMIGTERGMLLLGYHSRRTPQTRIVGI
jgi:hypothetical protein